MMPYDTYKDHLIETPNVQCNMFFNNMPRFELAYVSTHQHKVH